MMTGLGGWGTFLLWGLFDAVIATISFFFLRETKGLSLETIAHQEFRKNADARLVREVEDADGKASSAL